jgi:NAD(P)-dependent dehydrogenase (short-subunit alcohol dehydrogenase family)
VESELEGKVALVTGAASGIGRATALAFAAEGATVALLDRDRDGLEETRRRVVASGREASAHVVDVSVAAQVEQAHAAVIGRHERLDVAFNNAGITQPYQLLHETDEALFDQLMAIDVKGVWLGMRAQLRQMLAQDAGVIINTASNAAVQGFAGLGVYSGAKHAVVGLTRTAALEYAARGIRVNAVAPATVETPMIEGYIRDSGDPHVMDAVREAHPLGRTAQPEEIADAVVWLAGARSSFVTGHVLLVDGGYTVA